METNRPAARNSDLHDRARAALDIVRTNDAELVLSYEAKTGRTLRADLGSLSDEASDSGYNGLAWRLWTFQKSIDQLLA